MRYKSIARTGFEAHQLDFTDYDPCKPHRWNRELPEWLQNMIPTQKFYCEVNKNKKVAYLINDHGKLEVHEKMWVVRNSAGFVFVMIDSLFQESFAQERND